MLTLISLYVLGNIVIILLGLFHNNDSKSESGKFPVLGLLLFSLGSWLFIGILFMMKTGQMEARNRYNKIPKG